MISDNFLNSCFYLALTDSPKLKKERTIYIEILNILKSYEQKEKLEIPLKIKNKFDCLKQICKLKNNGKSSQNVIDSLSVTDKYAHLIDFLQTTASTELTDELLSDNINQVRLRKKLSSLFKNYDILSKFLSSIHEGSFESMDDLILDYEDIIKKLYVTMSEENRLVSIDASSSLDLFDDDYNPIVERILTSCEAKSKTPTGYDVLDREILNGGFEPSRLYIFGGGSGSGKSTLMTNFVNNAAGIKQTFCDSDCLKNVYVYVTLENSLTESLLRTYQSIYGKKAEETLTLVRNDPEFLKREINKHLEKTNSTIVMKYFPPQSISALDIMSVLDEVIMKYGKNSIRGVYVDYLDLLKTDIKYDLYRIELGAVTLSLKTMAVHYNVPVITGTQLGRDAYNVKDAGGLNLTQMSESVKKIEHADCICLLVRDQTDETLVHASFKKNRAGKSNVSLNFSTDFPTFRFLNCFKVAVSQSNPSSNSGSQNSYRKTNPNQPPPPDKTGLISMDLSDLDKSLYNLSLTPNNFDESSLRI